MDGPSSIRRRLQRLDPLWVDAVVAVALAAVTLIEVARASDASTSERWLSAAFMLAVTLPLALRRRYPFAVMTVVGTAATVYNVLDIPPDPYTPTFAVLLAVYSVSAYARWALAVTAAVITGIVLVVVNLPVMADENDFVDVVNQFVLIGGAWVVGQNTRYRQRQAELLQERVERAERERRERERIAVLEERGRLAREIHDVIAHSVGVIAVQAGAARAIAEQRPDRAREALAAIEETSKDALVELRGALGALRTPGAEAALRPTPGLDMLDELVEKVGRAGVAVSVADEGERRDLPSGVDLSAYRVVQEALTNTVKHAGATRAHVAIRREPEWLEVEVTDEGRTGSSPIDGDGPGAPPSGGQGLIGMRERVTILGGDFAAGPTGTGFAVKARFPLRSAEGVR